MSKEVTLEDILRTTNRLAYTETEIRHTMTFIKKELANDLDVNFHKVMMSDGRDDVRCWLEEGVLIIACPQIHSDFVFVKVNAGRGLLGRQKARFANYLGSVESK